ncbi:MAG: hypothetical protein HFI74_09370 [Lachnospiraceae bacterium]|nr:hypothetical protein [Lachnospiraceae bacterium]
MDYKQEIFYRNSQQNMSKVPFYMAYPMQTVYMEEMEYARDLEKLKGMYPKEVRSIQELVEDECDKMEYEGSLMFDEYPDKVMLDRIIKRIYHSATGSQPDLQRLETEQCDIGQYEREQYEDGAYEEFQEMDMEAEELPLEGTLIEQRGPGGPGWGPGRPPGPPPGPGWGPGRPPGPPPGPGWGPGRPPGPPPGPGWGPGRPPGPPPGNGLQNLIQVLLFNEMYQRRCRHKRCRRWW